MSAVLDTHSALWSVFDRKRISQTALQAIRRSVNAGKPLLVSAISLVETIYLVERRVAARGGDGAAESLR